MFSMTFCSFVLSEVEYIICNANTTQHPPVIDFSFFSIESLTNSTTSVLFHGVHRI